MTEPKSRRIPRSIFLGCMFLGCILFVLSSVIFIAVSNSVREPDAVTELKGLCRKVEVVYGDDGQVHEIRVESEDSIWAIFGGFRSYQDADMERLGELTSLEVLDLGGRIPVSTQITDKGLWHLRELTNLTHLDLGRWYLITDDGLSHLAGLTKLKTLDLQDTKITDAGLEHLGGLTSLRSLDLYNTKVTDEGVKKLQMALPNCNIRPRYQ